MTFRPLLLPALLGVPVAILASAVSCGAPDMRLVDAGEVAYGGSSGDGSAGTHSGGSGNADGADTACNASDLRCAGNPPHVLEGCKGDSTGWETLDSCATASLCANSVNAMSSTCMVPTCAMGEKQCSGADLQICNPGRDGWNAYATCVTVQLCQDGLGVGACAAPACHVGETKCSDDKTLQTCNSGRDGWVPQTCTDACLGGGDAGVAACGGICSPASKQCSGKTPQTCGPNGQWQSGVACAGAAPMCMDGECGPCPASGGPVMIPTPQGYCIDSTEVTAAQYSAWLATNPLSTLMPSHCTSWKTAYNPGTGSGDYPVTTVDWCDAYAYCKGTGKRLCKKIGGGSNAHIDHTDPTKSQWFNACSSGGANTYPYGITYQPQACNGSDYWTAQDASSTTTLPVGSLTGCQASVSGYKGVYDLSGNVWEWEDSCDGDTGMNDSCRVRGGKYNDVSDQLTCGIGFGGLRYSGGDSVGFRCCAP